MHMPRATGRGIQRITLAISQTGMYSRISLIQWEHWTVTLLEFYFKSG
jgi:hypothetical protein